MKKRVVIFIALIYLFCNCSTNTINMPNQNVKCTQDKILKIADAAMKKAGYKLEVYERIVLDNDTVLLIQYDFLSFEQNDSLMVRIRRGGGGEIKVSKDSCKIIEKKFYQ